MQSVRSLAVIFFYSLMFISLIIADIIMKMKHDKSVTGDMDIKAIPRSIIWLPVLAMLCWGYLIVHSIWYVVNPMILDYLLPIKVLRGDTISIIGMIFIVIGLVIFHTSQIQLGRSYGVLLQEKQKLITGGLYRMSRNPLYFGNELGLLGIFLIIPSWTYVIAMVILLTNNHFRILQEEKHLLKIYQDEYNEYKKKVGRYFIWF